MIAAVLAATMAACSAYMVDSGALFTQGLYRKYLVSGRSDRHYLWVGRFSGFSITMLGVLYTVFLIEKVLYSFLLTETMATFMGISFIGALLWKRANRWGALASIVVAFAVNFYLYYRSGQRLDHWDPNVFLYALLAGIAALVVVSLLTSAEPAAKIRDFFARLDVSADHSAGMLEASREEGKSHELEQVQDSTIGALSKKTIESGDGLLLIDLGRWAGLKHGVGFFHAYRNDLVGLAYCFGVVFLLIAIAYGILQL